MRTETRSPWERAGTSSTRTPLAVDAQGSHKDEVRYKKEYRDMARRSSPAHTSPATRPPGTRMYWFVQGRIDDVLSVAGHRIANAEVESSLVAHKDVAEAAVIGKPDEIMREAIVAFVILNERV